MKERVRCFWERGAVVYTWLTKSVSLGSERCLKRWELLTTSVCARVCASTRQDSTFDKHGEITMRRCQRVLSLAGRGRLQVSTTCDFLRWAENAWLRLISICTHTCLKMTHACTCSNTRTRTDTHTPVIVPTRHHDVHQYTSGPEIPPIGLKYK